jgi:hypothetical protein
VHSETRILNSDHFVDYEILEMFFGDLGENLTGFRCVDTQQPHFDRTVLVRNRNQVALIDLNDFAVKRSCSDFIAEAEQSDRCDQQ